MNYTYNRYTYKRYIHKVYCTPGYLNCFYRYICACTNNICFLNALSCDHKMGKDLKVRAVRPIHVKMSTMSDV